MSWSDLFYPGNPARRKKVAQLSSEILKLMETNFQATNDLIDVLHEHVPGRDFGKINVDHDKTIKDSCTIIVDRINEIQAYLEEKKKVLKNKLEPELYKQITDTNIKFAEKIALGTKISAATLVTVGTLTGVAVIALITKGRLLVGLVASAGTLAAKAIAGVMPNSNDKNFSAMVGAMERDKLLVTIEELEYSLKDFEPASSEYTKSIMRVQIMVEG